MCVLCMEERPLNVVYLFVNCSTTFVYLKGVYGLEEAVAEIKDLKTQINLRDREIEALTTDVNRLELKVNDVLDENEDLRERLGL